MHFVQRMGQMWNFFRKYGGETLPWKYVPANSKVSMLTKFLESCRHTPHCANRSWNLARMPRTFPWTKNRKLCLYLFTPRWKNTINRDEIYDAMVNRWWWEVTLSSSHSTRRKWKLIAQCGISRKEFGISPQRKWQSSSFTLSTGGPSTSNSSHLHIHLIYIVCKWAQCNTYRHTYPNFAQ